MAGDTEWGDFMTKKFVAAMLASAMLVPVATMAHTAPFGQDAAAAPVDPKEAARLAKEAAKAEAARQRAEAAQQRALIQKYGLGPYPEEIDNFLANKPDVLKPYYRTLYTGGERNSVLNFQRLGLVAIDNGLWKDAEWAFDHALDRIEAIFGDNPQAAAARSAFHNEANKDYKGEPYERAMAYYYRGLLYLRKGDFSNARATFKSAEYQDTLSDAETFQSDFAVMDYLIGWTQRCEGQESSAAESFGIAAKAQPGLQPPPPGDNVLFIAEMGNGPLKARDGAQAQKLVFQQGAPYSENSAVFEVKAGNTVKTVPTTTASSVYYQASTRGGRPIDGILNGKASLKGTTDTIGSAALNYGIASGDSTMMIAGAVFSLFSKTVKTQADIRQWDGLPDLISVGTMKSADANWQATPKFIANGQALLVPVTVGSAQPAVVVPPPAQRRSGGMMGGLLGGGLLGAAASAAARPSTQSAVATPTPTMPTVTQRTDGWPMMRGDPKPCSIVWSRSQHLSLSPDIVGEDPGVQAAVSRKPDVQKKDKAFRQSIEG